jgi:LysR family transcriptional regulator, mexEF-oprN operon transcriptional activator
MIQYNLISGKSIGKIMNIIERDFRGVDLNLLVTLMVLLRERSVSKAAACLHLGQPAVSGALARLRELFDDELLVRTSGGMQPTSRALELQSALAPAIESIQETVFKTPAFDPQTLSRTVVLGMSDWADIWLLPPLLARLHQEAPQLRIAVVVTDPFRGADMLARGEMDLGVGSFPEGPAWMRRSRLRLMRFRCVYNPALVRVRGAITLQQYTELPHLLVSYRGAFHGPLDDKLSALGLRRNVEYTSDRFSSLPGVLKGIAVIATVPEVLAARWEEDYSLVSCALPLDIDPFPVSLIRHAAREKDPALNWLCDVIKAIAH